MVKMADVAVDAITGTPVRRLTDDVSGLLLRDVGLGEEAEGVEEPLDPRRDGRVDAGERVGVGHAVKAGRATGVSSTPSRPSFVESSAAVMPSQRSEPNF